VIRSAIERSPQLYTRLGGVFYLAIIVLGIFGEVFVRGTLVAPGDPGATAKAIAASDSLWRAGIAGDLTMHVFDLPVIILLYVLLRPVDHGLALLATGLNLIQTAVLVANKSTLLLPLLLHKNAAASAAFSPEQLDALSYVAIQAHGYGFGVGLIFFGFACLCRGYLIFKSGFIPKILGVLLFVAGLSYLVNSFALLLAPALASALFPAILLPAFVGELSLALWLIFRGIDVAKWRAA
jgi:Domain of unknown function (DUF4386)